MRALILEDDYDVRQVIADILGEIGIHCIEVTNCACARELLQHNTFDLVVLDNGLPDGTGLDLVPEACARCNRVIMVTADGHELSFRKEATERGAEAVFAKPFDCKELMLHVVAERI